MNQNLQFSYPHPPIDFDKVWLHLHRLGTALYMDTYFKAWAYKTPETYNKDFYPEIGQFEDLYLFFKQGQFYGKYNIKKFGYKVLDYFVNQKNFSYYIDTKNAVKKEIEILWKK